VLPEEAGAVEWTYPLGADALNRAPLESVIVDVRFESVAELRSLLCPSHAVEVRREGARGARVTYEASRQRELREMRLWFLRSADEVALTVLSTLPRAGEGTFLASLAPPLVAEEADVVPRDVVYVLDTSGSMRGRGIEQAKAALKQGIAMLRPLDRFGIVAFLRSVDRPLLTDVRLEVAGAAGDEAAGERVFRLSGRRRGEDRTWEFRATSGEARHAYLERLWAQRKIAFLVDEMRLHGENKELVDEVIRLGTSYALVTPYTAGLVVEEGARSPLVFSTGGIEGAFRKASGSVPPGLREATGPTTPAGPTTPGEPATPASGAGPQNAALGPAKRATKSLTFPEQSKELRDRKETTVVVEIGTVRAIEDKTFRWTEEGRWVDTAWDGKSEPKRIEAWSPEHLVLIRTSDRVANYLSVGESVVLVLGETAYEIVPPP